MLGFIVVVKKTFRYSNVFSYNHLYQPECFYEKRYNLKQQQWCKFAHPRSKFAPKMNSN